MTQQVITLSKETLEIIKIAAQINNSIRFKPGKEIKTISQNQAVMMEAKISEEFPIEFSIYELNKLLGVLNLPNMKDADLVFEDEMKMTIQADKSKIQYYFTSGDFTEHPGKTINLPSVELETSISSEILESFQRAANALGHVIMEFRVVDEKAFLVATTPAIDTSNDYVVELGDAEDAPDGSYKLKIANLKILPGDYTVEICAKGLMKLTNKNRPVLFFVALEKTNS